MTTVPKNTKDDAKVAIKPPNPPLEKIATATGWPKSEKDVRKQNSIPLLRPEYLATINEPRVVLYQTPLCTVEKDIEYHPDFWETLPAIPFLTNHTILIGDCGLGSDAPIIMCANTGEIHILRYENELRWENIGEIDKLLAALKNPEPDNQQILQATAIGDSLGLPWEGLRPQPNKTDWNQCFFGGWGITSDDTQHAVITLQSLLESQGDPIKFRRILGRRLAIWFLCLPPGIGLATLRASVKLCLGMRAPKSGVRSAGNGPAMRAPILGWELWDQPEKLEDFIKISTETTHTDPKALVGALALGKTVAAIRAGKTDEEITQIWRDASNDALWQEMIRKTVDIRDPQEFLLATNQKKGVGGFIFHTVPSAFHVWLHHRENFEKAITTSLQMGGDADSSTAIVGALCAASGQNPPKKWEKVLDLPTEETQQKPIKQLGLNVLTTAAILIVHIPKRILIRLPK